MRFIVIGLGVQGCKRKKFAGEEFVSAVDPVNPEAQYRSVEAVPLSVYDAALVCIPDEPKVEVVTYLLNHRKHILLEKPLWAKGDEALQHLEQLARSKGVVCYTAYNHRFEPHFVKMRDLIASERLGKLYHCRMFYGNGTARLVKESRWRDQGAGVLPDLGSHLLDSARFWFGAHVGEAFQVVSANCFENRSPDHVVIRSSTSIPQLNLEMTLLSWRNDFTCDVLAENGTAHIRSLCKWGPTTFTVRHRVLPSGRPSEESVTFVQEDPTWELEYQHFKKLCERGETTDLSTDLWVNRILRNLSEEIMEKFASL